MRVVITGGGGFLGRKLGDALLARGSIAGADGKQTAIDELVLFDTVAPAAPAKSDGRLRLVTGDIADRATVERVLGGEAASVFHLAAVVSAAAEADFDLGMRVNLDGTRALLEACRALPRPPRLVFTSSIAVFGGALPDTLDDATALWPQTSYGAQKAIGELLVADYSRKGFIDGRSLRLPTIVVRPGKPNRAASGFASSIVREPLAGQEAVCPVTRDARMWVLSPRKAIAALIHAHELDAADWGGSRSVSLAGLTVAMGEMVESMGRIAGEAPTRRIRWEPDAHIQRIVATWPYRFDPVRARRLGFQADGTIDEIIRAHIEDELGGRVAG